MEITAAASRQGYTRPTNCIVTVLALVLVASADAATIFDGLSLSKNNAKDAEPWELVEWPDETRFHGMSYSPFGFGHDVLCPPWEEKEGDSMCLSNEQVRKDMTLIRKLTKRIRTYSLYCEDATRTALEFARETDMRVMLGLWIMNDDEANEKELQRMESALNDYGDVISHITVGNEPVFILKVPEKKLADIMKHVRGVVEDLPEEKRPEGGIGTADIWNAWMDVCTVDVEVRDDFDMQAVVDESDWIGLNSHPYWGGTPAKDAPKSAIGGAKAIAEKWKKPVIITETGYPSDGAKHKPSSAPGCPSSVTTSADPSFKALETFAHGIEELSRKEEMQVYFFEPFDGEWKKRWEAENNAGEVDFNWGLMTCDRKLKPIALPPEGAYQP